MRFRVYNIHPSHLPTRVGPTPQPRAVIPHRPPDEREVKTKSYLQLLAAGPEVVDELLIAKIGAPLDLFSIVVVIFTQLYSRQVPAQIQVLVSFASIKFLTT